MTPLTPADFLADVTEDESAAMRGEAQREQDGFVEFTVTREADPELHRGEAIRLQVPETRIDRRFTVVRVEPRQHCVSYSLMAAAGSGKRGEKVLRILPERLK